MLRTIGQISMNARDIDRATAFYTDTLGMKLLFRAGQMSFFDCDGVRVMLSRPETPEYDHPGSVLYFKIADIEQTHRALADKGVTFLGAPHLIARMPDHDLWMAFFKDTEGNILAIVQDVR